MLSSVGMRRIVPLLYNLVCSIFVQKEVIDKRGVTTFLEEVLYENVPCRMSYVSHKPSKSWGKTGVELAYESRKKVKLFLDSSLVVPVGAVVVISGQKYLYSGASAVYSGHQEIVMEEVLDC
ncbi:MAG: hypothetical protein R3Y53_11525 [Bacillota bacterium]